ncbi:TonB-dependent hemoglobin/transferrin/lactoferrin family receptor [Vibrio sp. SS-MA-C1-2]|uniref:TonB-dependent hemoglobin/transferrin/lactoferrin family receptor n=1 Tax=Vibrio sp. SS-MA-C1-2 TaxID=2908646 RepID=UPI001F16788B|nr:TonB-dependent hemoglobin/transferrin/lactoferrin family receptor [Vibrio sp. SS-MA-C1-2]UJF17328.1 TonB-dependent hemoglobin/transferrin/lactoferrin family receptor [Vibrio sp. SS-MA-C1-2]
MLFQQTFKKTLLTTSILLTLPAFANTNSGISYFDEVVVSATKTEQSKKDVSSSIETISASDLDETMSSDLKEALKYTPGVDAEGTGRFGISGFNIRGMDADQVKMMIDGVQQPTPYNPGSNEQRQYPNAIEIDTLQAIEINKGPSSTLYGSDAMAGAVVLRTKNPSDLLKTDGDEQRFGFKSGYTSADETFKTTLHWAARKDKVETLLMATYAEGGETKTYDSESRVEGSERGAANPADKKLGNLLGKTIYHINDQQNVGLTVEYYDSKYNEEELNYNGYEIMPGFVYTDNYNKDHTQRLRVGVEHEINTDMVIADTLDWSLNYQENKVTNKNYDTTDFNGRRLRERKANDTAIQFDGQLTKIIDADNSSHEITYGVNYSHNDFDLSNTDYKFDLGTVTPGSTGMPDATMQQWGIFVQDQAFLLEERLVVTTGLRYDYFVADPSTDEGYTRSFDKNQDDSFTGRLGTVYHFNDNLSLYGQISQGFKAPTVYDLYYYYDQGAIIEANPDLKAERSISYETGLRGGFEAINFELSAYYNHYKDFINDRATGENVDGKDVYERVNLDNVEIYGAEFSSTLYLDTAFNAPEGMYSRFTIAYTDGEDKKTGDTLDSIAPLTSVLGLGIDRDNYGAMTNIKMVDAKTDWQEADNWNTAGYTVVDLTAYYIPAEDLILRAGIFNLFDREYSLYSDISGKTSSTRNNPQFYSQPGRNWSVNIEYSF